jgi:mono/diheme cytochrome c family protein
MSRLSLIAPIALLVGCGPASSDTPTCEHGLDADADEVCDRDRADWSEGATVDAPRSNIFELDEDDLAAAREEGLAAVWSWPIDISGVLLPYGALTRFFSGAESDPRLAAVQSAARATIGFGTMDEMYDWLGLPRVQPGDALPAASGYAVGDALGAGVVDTRWGEALTFSCAACHVANLFGHTVVGLTNRQTRANEFFHLGQTFFPAIDPDLFQDLTQATPAEMEVFARTNDHLEGIGAKVPSAIGLDTSLAQVALSLAKREADAWATSSDALESTPRPNALEHDVADSKPMVWWNLRYKNRWLSDGSIVSGNPVFTNFLWNEIGRGTDLRELEAWLVQNQRVADTLTVALFATEAPRWTDILPAFPLDLEAAKRGQVAYEARCASCHGTYQKGWDAPDAAMRDPIALAENMGLDYPADTPVIDVGTDPGRAAGMPHFADGLNGLAISAWMETVVKPQAGYVPPPLDGIWARFPYLHNHSVPTLCALLTPADERPTQFWIGPSDDPQTDFDADCVGLPIGDATPAAWKDEPAAAYDTTRPGLSNAGHDAMLTGITPDERADLIDFLRTL